MEIKTRHDIPTGPIPALRLAHVPRWGIIKMNRKQSVAEHSFNVAHIAMHILGKYEHLEGLEDYPMIAYMALVHDEDELYTGDIPSPAKMRNSEPVRTRSHPTDIVLLADVIEAYIFAMCHFEDTAAVWKWLENGLWERIKTLCEVLNIPINDIKILTKELT